MRAEQRVKVKVRNAESDETRSFLALLGIERPQRFRLRALGPGSVTLFDILYVAGDVQVVSALRDPKEGKLADLLRSVAGDLAAAYDLAPVPEERTRALEDGAVVVREPGRTTRLSEFKVQAGKVYATRIDIDNSARAYQVEVRTMATELDVSFDAELWSPYLR